LQFHNRLLNQALAARTPLPQAVKRLARLSAALDDFFIQLPVEAAARPGHIHEQLLPITQRLHRGFNAEIQPRLAQNQVYLLCYDRLETVQITYLRQVFEDSVFPILTPLGVGPAHPFPRLVNLSLNLAVSVQDPDTSARRFACVAIPDTLPRFIRLPAALSTVAGQSVSWVGVTLEDLIAHHLNLLFPGMRVLGHCLFRPTQPLKSWTTSPSPETPPSQGRLPGPIVRLEVAASFPAALQDLLLRELQITERQIYLLEGFLNLKDLSSMLPALTAAAHGRPV
jgi:polyphosphate kinase